MLRLPDKLIRELDATGLPWSREPGTRHDKLILNGQLIGILPHGRTVRSEKGKDRAFLNLRAHIRRLARSRAA